jgi:hypothetical protein
MRPRLSQASLSACFTSDSSRGVDSNLPGESGMPSSSAESSAGLQLQEQQAGPQSEAAACS